MAALQRIGNHAEASLAMDAPNAATPRTGEEQAGSGATSPGLPHDMFGTKRHPSIRVCGFSVVASGDVDAECAVYLAIVLDNLLGQQPDRMRVDLTAITVLSDEGREVLMSRQRCAAECGVAMQVTLPATAPPSHLPPR